LDERPLLDARRGNGVEINGSVPTQPEARAVDLLERRPAIAPSAPVAPAADLVAPESSSPEDPST